MTVPDRASSGGCAGKLEQEDLERLLEPSSEVFKRVPTSGEISDRIDLGDACEVRLRTPTNRLVTSADLLYPLASRAEDYGYISAVHALSDLYSAFAQPLFGTVTLGLTRDAVADGTGSAILQGVTGALQHHGAVIAGGHSVVAAETFVGLAVTGRARVAPLHGEPLAGDLIILSKPLGTGVALSARKMGLASEDQLTEEYVSMRHSNEAAADLLFALNQAEPGSVRRVTDVSGFGLLYALRVITGPAVAQVRADQLPIFPLTAELVGQQVWSGLADSNLAASQDYTAYQDIARDHALVPVLLNDPQTSGGLLAIVSSEAWDRVTGETSHAGWAFSRIGHVVEPAARLRIVVTGQGPELFSRP